MGEHKLKKLILRKKSSKNHYEYKREGKTSKYKMRRRWRDTTSGKYISLLITRNELVYRGVEYAVHGLEEKRIELSGPAVLG